MKYLVLILSIVIIGCDKGEIAIDPHKAGDIITQQLHTGNEYETQIFYNLENNEVVSSNSKYIWDIGFETSKNGWHVITNSARLLGTYNTGETNFENVSTKPNLDDYVYDSPQGVLDSTAIGDYRDKNEVYIINRGENNQGVSTGFRKVIINQINDQEYSIRLAKLNGKFDTTIIIKKDSSINFVAFSFDSLKAVDVEPQKNKWDLKFAQYTEFIWEGNVKRIPYLVSGVLTNPNKVIVAFDKQTKFEDIVLENVGNYSYKLKANSIGYYWKYYDFDKALYTVKPQFNYIIKSVNDLYYKLHFIDFYNEQGEKGSPKFEVQLL